MTVNPINASASDVAIPMHGGTPPQAYLIIFTSANKEVVTVRLDGNKTFGREVPDNTPDIAVDSPIISRNHGVFTLDYDGVYYQDAGSFNGTFINGTFYNKNINPCSSPIKLNDGDVLRFDSIDSKKSHENAVTIVFSTTYDKRSKWRRKKITGANTPIGVSNTYLIEFEPENMAYHNATVIPEETGCMIYDMARRNNIRYHNRPAGDSFRVRNKDVFMIDQNYIFYDKGELVYNICFVTTPGLEIRLDETHVTDKLVKKVLLRDVHMTVDNGDFVLIIGGSGAGKSTFMNSILGKYDITGTIAIDGQQSSGSNDLTAKIAYVPQTLPLRKEERLIDVVTDTCVLRCQREMSRKERKQFIMDALDSVGLKAKANTEIKKLSGGEQRRAAIANEIVTDARIFFLDEPDSGLDPKSGMELMNNLKSLSDVGKIVMLISHNYASYPMPHQIYTKVVILAKSNKDNIGRLAFCGSVKEALEFFGVEALKDITKLINPVSENGEGRADEFVEKFRRMNGYGN